MEKKDLIVSISAERIEGKILLIRGQKVMFDRDLAELYGVETRVLNQAVRRNIKRFPDDFMFQLTKEENNYLRSQFVTLKKRRGQHRKYLPYAFTEHGILMLSSVLNSEKAIQINIRIMRAFTKLRDVLATHKDLQKKIEEHDKQIKYVFQILNRILTPPRPSRKKIGFL